MTNAMVILLQIAETQSAQRKKKVKNVDSLWVSCLIFAAEYGYFSQLVQITI